MHSKYSTVCYSSWGGASLFTADDVHAYKFIF